MSLENGVAGRELPAGSPPSPSSRHPNWILAAVCLLALMSTVGAAMPYPILAPIFFQGPADGFTRFAGVPPSVLMGVALAANPLGILVGSLYAGPLSDRHGRRAVLGVTLVATLAGHLMTAGALAARQYPLFVLARFATGLTESNVAVARALVADLDGPIDRTTSFAWLNAFLFAGWLVGPLVGGTTFAYGEAVPFLVAAAMMLPCLAVLVVGLPAPASPASGATRSANAWALLRADRALVAVCALQLAYALGINAFYEFEPLWMLQQAGLGSRGIAAVVAMQCAVMTMSSLVASRVGSAPGHPLRRAASIALVAAAGLALLGVLPGRAGLAAIVTLGVPTALYNAVLPAWMSERFAAHGQGRVMGLLSTIFCVANVTMALAGGAIALLSTRWIMALGGMACIGASLLMLRVARREEARGD